MSNVTLSKHLPWVVTIFLSLLLWLQTCHYRKVVEKKQDQITNLQLDKQKQDSVISKQGRTIHTQKAIIAQTTQSLNNLTDTIFDLKKRDSRNLETIAYFKEVLKVKATEIKVPFLVLDSLRMKKFSDSLEQACAEPLAYYRDFLADSTIQIPKKAAITNDSLSISLTVNKTGVNIDSLSIPDTLQLRFVEHGGLLKRKSVEVQYFHTNPLFKTEKFNSAFYRPRKKLKLLEKAIFVGVGIFLGSKL